MHYTDWIKYKMQLLIGFYVCTVLHRKFIHSAYLTWDHVNMEVKSPDFTHWFWCQTNIHILFHASKTQSLTPISCLRQRVYVCLAPKSMWNQVTSPPYRIFLIAERQPNSRVVPGKKTLTNSEILPEMGKCTCTDNVTDGQQTKRNDHMSYQSGSQSSDHCFLREKWSKPIWQQIWPQFWPFKVTQ